MTINVADAGAAFARSIAPPPERALLTVEEFGALVYLLSLLNDTRVTQIDRDESEDLSRLLYKIQNDGDDRPLPIVDDRT